MFGGGRLDTVAPERVVILGDIRFVDGRIDKCLQVLHVFCYGIGLQIVVEKEFFEVVY